MRTQAEIEAEIEETEKKLDDILDPIDETELQGFLAALKWVVSSPTRTSPPREVEIQAVSETELDYVVKSDGKIILRYDNEADANVALESMSRNVPDRTFTIERG